MHAGDFGNDRRIIRSVNPLPEFLQPLLYVTRPFPREAMAAAIERADESVPHLLHAIEWVNDHLEEANEPGHVYMLHLFALHILAQLREVRALEPTIRLFRNPRNEEVTGFTAAESLPRVLASICGGDAGPIKAVIEDEDLDEFVRGAAVASLGVLMHNGIKSRDEISAYFRELFRHRLLRQPSYVWNSLIAVCADLAMPEHLVEIRRAYAENLADEMFDNLQDVEYEIALLPGTSTRTRWEHYALLDDAIGEMQWWHCFQPDPPEKARKWDEASLRSESVALDSPSLSRHDPPEPRIPVVRAEPKIGRNDLCPCGSGKKYKRCCGKS